MNEHKKIVANIGYLGVGSYARNSHMKVYSTWTSMLQRCYNKKKLERDPVYKDITVCDEWHNFQNFAQWFEENYVIGFHLDKDILLKNNKTYSPETCCFIPQEINKLFTKSNKTRGEYPIGIIKIGKKYLVKFGRNRDHLGMFETIESAFNEYKIVKEIYIKEVAEKWKNEIGSKVYQAMINYKVEITD